MEQKSAVDTLAESNRIGVDLLINDAKTALTFLDLAESTKNVENRSRRVAEACKAYRSILSFLGCLAPSAEQTEILRSELAILTKRLKAAGVEVDGEG